MEVLRYVDSCNVFLAYQYRHDIDSSIYPPRYVRNIKYMPYTSVYSMACTFC